MTSRLKSFAEEIELFLGVKRDPEDTSDETRLASARQRGAVAQSKLGEHKRGSSNTPTIIRRRKVSQASIMTGPTQTTGLGGSASGGRGASGHQTSTSANVSPGMAHQLQAIQVFKSVLAAQQQDDDEVVRRGGGSRRSSDIVGSSLGSSFGYSAPAQVAARAAVSAGAQEAVFKVISSASSKVRAGALLSYIGTREDENGERADIPVYTNEGFILADGQDRKEFLDDFSGSFEAPLQNTNFIEVKFDLQEPTNDDELRDALNVAFDHKPLVYARSRQTVKVYALTNKKAAAISKVLAEGRENSRSKVVEKLESGFVDAFANANITASAEIVAAVGNERKAAYFLQKFIRSNRGVKHADGNSVKGAGNPQRAAAIVFDAWKKDIGHVAERRNAFHLLFSAKAGTDPQAVMLAARAVLEDKAFGHKYAFAYHGDTQHVHVHVMVQAVNELGDRLNFRKGDLYDWREAFAEKARENNIAMVATSRHEHAKPRPYTKEHAGALKRAQSDIHYDVLPSTENRVLDKQSGVIDPETARRDGFAIGEAWRQTARAMELAGVDPRLVENADRFADSVVRFVDRHDIPESTSIPELANLSRHLVALEIADSQNALREPIFAIHDALNRLEISISDAQRAELAEYRAGINEIISARLSSFQVEVEDGAERNPSDDIFSFLSQPKPGVLERMDLPRQLLLVENAKSPYALRQAIERINDRFQKLERVLDHNEKDLFNGYRSEFDQMLADRLVALENQMDRQGLVESNTQNYVLDFKNISTVIALIGELEMAKTPAEMKTRINGIHATLDEMEATLPGQDRVAFKQFRGEINVVLNDRLASIQTQSQHRPDDIDDVDVGAADGPRDTAQSVDAQNAENDRAMNAPAVKKDAEKKVDGKKAEAKKHSETIAARRQRERDNDRGR